MFQCYVRNRCCAFGGAGRRAGAPGVRPHCTPNTPAAEAGFADRSSGAAIPKPVDLNQFLEPVHAMETSGRPSRRSVAGELKVAHA